jgi:hypothetical protein
MEYPNICLRLTTTALRSDTAIRIRQELTLELPSGLPQMPRMFPINATRVRARALHLQLLRHLRHQRKVRSALLCT